MNYIIYTSTGITVWLISVLFMLPCRGEIEKVRSELKGRRIGMSVLSLLVTCAIVFVSSILNGLINRVTTGDSMFTKHLTWMSLIPAVLLVALLFLFFIRPIAKKINF
jgi:hypothetical protein